MKPVRFSASRWTRSLLLAVSAVSLVALAATTVPPPGPVEPAAGNQYVGAAKCKNCHKSDAGGNQYAAWEKMKHAKAFETLATDAAKEAGKKAGVENPQTDAKCLKCHVTAAAEPKENVASGFKPELGVQCESCHGAGGNHVKARFAAAASAKPGEKVTVGEGEINARPTAATCVGCHNKESPSYKPFCFAKASKELLHLDPRKTRTPEEKAALEKGCACGECKCDENSGPGCGAAGK